MSEQSESGCHCADSSEVRERTGDESLRNIMPGGSVIRGEVREIEVPNGDKYVAVWKRLFLRLRRPTNGVSA